VAPRQPEYWRLTIGRPSTEAVPLLLGRVVTSPRRTALPIGSSSTIDGFSRSGLPAVRGVSAFIDELAASHFRPGTVSLGLSWSRSRKICPSSFPCESQPLRVISAGRLIRTKGFDRLVRGCARFHKTGGKVELTILGRGDQERN